MVKKCFDIFVTVLVISFACAVVSPVILTFVFSFGDGFGAYVEFFTADRVYLKALSNSLLISLPSSVLGVFVAVMAAYVLAKVKFRGRGIIIFLYVVMMIMPFQVTMLPQYIVSKKLLIYDTPFALILPAVFSPLTVFLLTQVMKTVPDEMTEAARLDTNSTWKILFHILIPYIRTGLITAWVLSFTETWNAVAEPLTLLETHKKYPLSAILSDVGPSDTLTLAATVIFVSIPAAIFAMFSKDVMKGLGGEIMK